MYVKGVYGTPRSHSKSMGIFFSRARLPFSALLPFLPLSLPHSPFLLFLSLFLFCVSNVCKYDVCGHVWVP